VSLAGDITLGATVRAIPILRSGVLARDTCRRGGPAEVAAVFARSFYLRAGEAFVCVGAPAIGSGPLTLIADIGGAVPLSDLGLRAGQRAEMSARHLAVGGAVRFDLGDSELWRAPGWPALAPGRLGEARDALARCAAVEAPVEGLARLALAAHDPVAEATPLGRTARKRIAGFESWLSAALGSSPSPRSCGERVGVRGSLHTVPTRGESPSPGAQARADLSPQAGRGEESIRGLIGLGPGLTPSGDDFLSGALALLDALGMQQVHARLAQAVIDAAALTSPLSACFLRAAAGGHIGEYLHRALASLITGEVDAAIAAVGRIGHSSGWDMLAGAATTLRVVVHELPITDGPAARLSLSGAAVLPPSPSSGRAGWGLS
jgi:hypothetical protein